MVNYFPSEANERLIYAVFVRDVGSGPIRLGTSLQPNQDIYALLLASNFRLSIIDKHRWEYKLNQDQLEEAY